MAKEITRRDLIGTFGSASLLLWPLLRASRACGQQGQPPRRFIGIYHPNGVNTETFWRSGSNSPFAENGSLYPLVGHQDYLRVFDRGLDKRIYNSAEGNGVGGHWGEITTHLTGRTIHTEQESFPKGPSIDQVLANALPVPGAIPSIAMAFGLGRFAGTMTGVISYNEAGQPIQTLEDPRRIFEVLFRDFVDASCGDGQTVALLHARRRSVLDALTGRLKDAPRVLRLGADESRSLAEYAETIRGLELQLGAQPRLDAKGCVDLAAIDRQALPDAFVNDNIPVLSRLMIDLIAAAFRFDRTRIVTFMRGYCGSEYRPTWLRFRDGPMTTNAAVARCPTVHEVAHGDAFQSGAAEPVDAVDEKQTIIDAWHAADLAYLMDKLKSVAEGDTHALHNSTVLAGWGHWGNHVLYSHVPWLLCGRGGGYFQAGSYQVVAPNAEGYRPSHISLLVAAAHAMGVPLNTDKHDFGPMELGKIGPLL